jgi:hypothetical protein
MRLFFDDIDICHLGGLTSAQGWIQKSSITKGEHIALVASRVEVYRLINALQSRTSAAAIYNPLPLS